MVGLAAFGCMNAVLVGRRADRRRALGRLEPPAAADAALDAHVLPDEGADRLRDGRSARSLLLYIAGATLGVRLSAGHWLHMTGFILDRADPVRRARHPARPPADRRLDRAGDRRHHRALLDSRRDLVPDHERRACATSRRRCRRTGSCRRPTSASAATAGDARLARRRGLDGGARRARGARVPPRHRPRLSTIAVRNGRRTRTLTAGATRGDRDPARLGPWLPLTRID